MGHRGFLFVFKIILFLGSGEGKEKEGEKQCVAASRGRPPPPTGDLARSAGMCPDWESNQQPFASQPDTQSTEPH